MSDDIAANVRFLGEALMGNPRMARDAFAAADEIEWLRADRDQLREVLLSAMRIILQPWQPDGTLEREQMPYSVRDLMQKYEQAMRYVRVGDLIVNVHR